MTSEKETSVKNCIVKVTNEIKSFLEENKYDKKDIIKIVHLIDTHGAFVNNDKIYDIDYCMYYFSCNLEHVLHNEENINDHLKEEYADKFLDKFIDNERKFIEFICTSDFSVFNDYIKSWEFIKKDTNSLKRYCNLGLLFKIN